MRGREGYRRGSGSRAANISTALTRGYSWAEDGGVRREKGVTEESIKAEKMVAGGIGCAKEMRNSVGAQKELGAHELSSLNAWLSVTVKTHQKLTMDIWT